MLARHITLYFIRHGETDWNAERRLQGTTDVPLNATGRAQAARHGRVMAGLGVDWSEFDFQASPLSRTRETMEIVRREIGATAGEVTYDSRLREGAFGRWEGRTWHDIAREEPEAHDAFRTRGWDEAPHGGESYGDIARRVGDWAAEIRRDTVVVSHGGVSRVLRGLYLGIGPVEVLSLPTPQTSFFRFRGGEVDLI